ncbi:unnamed protein product [Protopolystoma xenopodis]|uniref:Uncharacterized protein n=1 Tax=Protopolystoma xenopodis TaxID=117903 RepID=A0A3S5ANB9_9PLAT|nr:unnamed protein product [Protopolystoma xenopodis]
MIRRQRLRFQSEVKDERRSQPLIKSNGSQPCLDMNLDAEVGQADKSPMPVHRATILELFQQVFGSG